LPEIQCQILVWTVMYVPYSLSTAVTDDGALKHFLEVPASGWLRTYR